ncbi:hypothetical protein MRX96_059411 [Rhipicephalus microplus]
MATFNILQDDLPCPFNPDHDAPAEPDGYLQHLATTCPDKTTMLLCTQTSYDPPYEVPAPGGAQPFHHEPDKQWVVEPARACISPVTECERPPGGTCLPSTRSRQPHVPATCSMHVIGKAGCGDVEHRWDQARELEPKAEQQPGFRHISDRAALQPTGLSSPEPCIPAQSRSPAHKRLLVAPQATKASPPPVAQALATHEQSNQASKRYVQVPLDHNDRPRSTKAGKPSASQATQPVIDYPKNPLLTVQAEHIYWTSL